jgi:hypothetical protein
VLGGRLCQVIRVPGEWSRGRPANTCGTDEAHTRRNVDGDQTSTDSARSVPDGRQALVDCSVTDWPQGAVSVRRGYVRYVAPAVTYLTSLRLSRQIPMIIGRMMKSDDDVTS